MGTGFPIGLGYVASYLQVYGYQVSFYDALQHHANIEQTLRAVHAYDAKYIGLGFFTVNSKVAVTLAHRIKERWPDKIIIAGGPHASQDWENMLTSYPWFDFIIRGEGEIPTLKLIQALENGRDYLGIPGLTFLRNGRIVTSLPVFEKNLDQFPFPARELVPFNTYVNRSTVLPYQVELMSSRGCTHACIFCSNQKRFRARSVRNVFAEMDYILQMWPIVKSFAFLDDDFSGDKRRLLEFCQTYIEYGWARKYRWSCSCRVDEMDEQTIRAMAKAGCSKILFGLEAADEDLLRTLRKKINLAQVEASVKLSRKLGIPTILFVMLGNPGETRETIRKSFHFIRRLPCEAVSAGILQVYPGTVLSNMLSYKPNFIEYIYQPEVDKPGPVNANVVLYDQNPGLDRETLKLELKRFLRNLVLWKILTHPIYALRKLFNMPNVAIRNFLWLLGLKREG